MNAEMTPEEREADLMRLFSKSCEEKLLSIGRSTESRNRLDDSLYAQLTAHTISDEEMLSLQQALGPDYNPETERRYRVYLSVMSSPEIEWCGWY